jgi:hypothetical protein
MALKFDMSNPQWQQQYGNQLYGGGAPDYAQMGEAIGMGAGLLGKAMHKKFAPAGKAYEEYRLSGDFPEGELPKSYEAWKATDWKDQRLEERAKRFGPKYEGSPLLKMFFDKEAGKKKEDIIAGFGGYGGLDESQKTQLEDQYRLKESEDMQKYLADKGIQLNTAGLMVMPPSLRKLLIESIPGGEMTQGLWDKINKHAAEFATGVKTKVLPDALGGGYDDEKLKEIYGEDPSKYYTDKQKEALKEAGPDKYKFTPFKGLGYAAFGGTEEGADYTGLVPGVLGAGAKAFTGTTEKAGKALDNLIQSQTKTAGYGGGVLADVMKQGKLGMENVRQENIEKKEKIKEFFGSDQMRKIFRPKQYKAEIEASSGASGYDKYASSFSKDIGNSLANAINTYPGLKSKLTKEDYEKLSYLSEMDKGGLGRGGSVGQRAQEFINEILGREQLLSKNVSQLNASELNQGSDKPLLDAYNKYRNVDAGSSIRLKLIKKGYQFDSDGNILSKKEPPSIKEGNINESFIERYN